jgi:hypothetical protein
MRDPNHHAMTRRAALGCLGLFTAGAAGVPGCSGTTGLRRIHFTLYAGGVERDAQGPLTFRNAAGWDVTLTVAQVAAGPVYFNVAPPLSWRTRRRRGLLDALVGTAHADETADHLAGGRIIAQVTERAVIDALSPALQRLGDGSGVSEPALSAEVWLLPEAPTGPILPGPAAAVVRGVAVKGAVSVPFLARLLLDEKAAMGQTLQQLRAARRIPAELDFTQLPDGASLALRIDPRPWLFGVDFTELRDRPLEDGAHVAAAGDQLMRELLTGVRQSRGVYTFSSIGAP